VLLIDPYLRFFVDDFGQKDQSVWVKIRDVPQDRQPIYACGWLCMQALWNKRSSHAIDKDSFIQRMREIYRQMRQDSWLGREDDMADVQEKLPKALAALRCFVAYNWQGQPFQAHWLAYGTIPILRHTSRCVREDCPSGGRKRYRFHDGEGTSLMLSTLNLLTQTEQFMWRIDLIHGLKGGNDLQQLVRQNFMVEGETSQEWGQWFPLKTNQRWCPQCYSGQLIHKDVLNSLPWMLYLRVPRDPKHPSLLRYDPELLEVGPAFGRQFARYRLMARARFRGRHYVMDIRPQQSQAHFTRYDFDKVTQLEGELPEDKEYTVQVWQRME
jgi:hypothetical protein